MQKEEIELAVKAARKVVASVISTNYGPAAPTFDEFDREVERARGKWYAVDGDALDELRKVLGQTPAPGSLEEIRVDPRFILIMCCLWLDIEEMANRFNTCKHDYAEGARAAAAYVLDHWKHGDHLKLISEKDIKDRLSRLQDGA